MLNFATEQEAYTKRVDIFSMDANNNIKKENSEFMRRQHGADIEIADVNNDKLKDVVILNSYSTWNSNAAYAPNIGVLNQTKTGFAPAEYYYILDSTCTEGNNDSDTMVVESGDVNSDGRIDLVVGFGGNSEDGPYACGAPPSRIALLYQNQKGKFDAPFMVKSHDIPSSLAVGDINGDRFEDIVVFHNGQKESIGIYLQKNGQLYEEQLFVPPAGGLDSWNPSAVAIGDLNSDKKNEVIIADNDVIIELYNFKEVPK